MFSIPFKIEFKNCYQIITECFGIEAIKKENKIVKKSIIINQPKLKNKFAKAKVLMVDASTNTDLINEETNKTELNDFIFVE